MIDPDESVLEGMVNKELPILKDDRVTSNMAVDQYKSMFGLGTYNGSIKIINLKGYEQDIQKAHDCAIEWLLFVPNQGILISIDCERLIKIWELKGLTCVNTISVPSAPGNTISCLYMPKELTT